MKLATLLVASLATATLVLLAASAQNVVVQLDTTGQGQPLYTRINDSAAGQTTGDGVKGVWHLAR